MTTSEMGGGNSKSLKVGVHRLQKPPPPANMGSRDNVHGKGQGVKPWHFILFQIATQKLQWQVCHAKKKKKRKKGKADLTTVLHIREVPHLHMKLAVWFSFPTTNNKNSKIPS